jgi:hypothetical protein
MVRMRKASKMQCCDGDLGERNTKREEEISFGNCILKSKGKICDFVR